MDNYFDNSRIGSSLLADCIVSVDPLAVCCDRATVEKAPSSAMEMGKIFEDRIEEIYADKLVFSDKYFHSSVHSFPETSRKDLKDILEILEQPRSLT